MLAMMTYTVWGAPQTGMHLDTARNAPWTIVGMHTGNTGIHIMPLFSLPKLKFHKIDYATFNSKRSIFLDYPMYLSRLLKVLSMVIERQPISSATLWITLSLGFASRMSTNTISASD